MNIIIYNYIKRNEAKHVLEQRNGNNAKARP